MKQTDDKIAEIAEMRDKAEHFVRGLSIRTFEIRTREQTRKIYLIRSKDLRSVQKLIGKIEDKIERIASSPKPKRLWLPLLFAHVQDFDVRTYDAFTNRGEQGKPQKSGLAYKLRVVTPARTYFTNLPQWSVISGDDQLIKLTKKISVRRGGTKGFLV